MIIGEKVFLRPILKEDVKLLNEWKNDEETFRFLGGGFMPVSLDQHKEWMDSIIDTTGENKRFMICTKDKNPIGMVGLYDINWVHRTCEIGIYIGEQNVRGKGYGKEACSLIEEFARKYLNLRKIKLNVVFENAKAIHLWEKLNYEIVGVLKKERFINDEYKDLVIMEKFLS
ncbi:hypothetical protein CAI16_14965 [Virgibacillus dokdonensis]|uniref:N-acetyltransferase domain-containing protein n=1 Tax=Virgibacillus dokdonensis TaxID=302167 RepID=A0A3E0WN21_9BACI|nr:GNAT family protein [Virgibacillus dokdonensis]RFA33376.1 hypothetical protein CAI16_14965 [Virgibacillus dokdonensis]